MIEPNDEQIEELARAMFEDDDVIALSWEDARFGPAREMMRRYARTAFAHVARQIMPIQVGDRVAYNVLIKGPIYATVRAVELSSQRTVYEIERDANRFYRTTGRYLTLVPAGESGEEGD